MAARLCWHCDNRSHLVLLHSYTLERRRGGLGGSAPAEILAGFFQCDECGYPSIGLAARLVNDRSVVDNAGWLGGRTLGVERPAEVAWLPERASGRNFPDAPPTIADTADEAYRCHSIGAHRGALALARAVVEATAKDQGIANGNLYSKIEKLEEQRIIRPSLRKTLDHVRFLGNDVAHGDLIDPPTEEEASLALEFIAQLLEEVYVLPARLARAEAARQARLGGSSA